MTAREPVISYKRWVAASVVGIAAAAVFIFLANRAIRGNEILVGALAVGSVAAGIVAGARRPGQWGVAAALTLIAALVFVALWIVVAVQWTFFVPHDGP
ncbi:MAG TPA: hypothetical protein VKA85_10650 [Candidatus Limnocylindrales bacterium]|nr:hypothetical protein [Candidatus Limnocylindrales bacterium]